MDPANGTDYCPNRIWLNDGNGNFTDAGQVFDQGSRHLHDIKLADVNNNGSLDMIMGITTSPYIQVYNNDGEGHLDAGQSFGNLWVSSLDLGDLNNDGWLDLVFVSGDCSIEPVPKPGQAWVNDGTGIFTLSNNHIGNAISSDVKLADLNKDDRLEIFVVNWNWDGTHQCGSPSNIWLNNSYICDYFGLALPGDTAVIFAEGIISLPERYEYNITISPDGTEICFRADDGIYFTRYIKKSWTTQIIEPVFDGYNHPVFSPDGNKMYLFKYKDGYEKSDIYVSERNTDGWNEPQILPEPINSSSRDDEYTESRDGMIYFDSNRSGNWAIWSFDTATKQALNLGSEFNSNSAFNPCVAPRRIIHNFWLRA